MTVRRLTSLIALALLAASLPHPAQAGIHGWEKAQVDGAALARSFEEQMLMVAQHDMGCIMYAESPELEALVHKELPDAEFLMRSRLERGLCPAWGVGAAEEKAE